MSAKPRKGEEQPRSLLDDLALLVYIVMVGFNYAFVGRPIRKRFQEQQRTGGKFYVDEDPSPRRRG